MGVAHATRKCALVRNLPFNLEPVVMVDFRVGLYAIDSEDAERAGLRVIEFARLQRLNGLLERIEETMAIDRNFGC